MLCVTLIRHGKVIEVRPQGRRTKSGETPRGWRATDRNPESGRVAAPAAGRESADRRDSVQTTAAVAAAGDVPGRSNAPGLRAPSLWTWMMVAPGAGLSRSLRSLALASLNDGPAFRPDAPPRSSREGAEVRCFGGPVARAASVSSRAAGPAAVQQPIGERDDQVSRRRVAGAEAQHPSPRRAGQRLDRIDESRAGRGAMSRARRHRPASPCS